MRCPECRTEQSRREDGACPNCHTPVEIYGGRWYRKEDGSPNLNLVRLFEELYSAKLSSKRDKPIIFTFPRRSPQYKRNLVVAEKLLDEADGDLDTCREALRLLFQDEQFRWKSFTSLLFVRNDWPAALAIARANIEEQRKGKEAEQNFFDKISVLDDDF